MLSSIEIPKVFRIRQQFARPRVDDRVDAVTGELEKLFSPDAVAPESEIGITVGSRGIRGIADMARAAVDFFKSRGARPFILPAMGSHGGATAENQARLIAHYGVTEGTMGCSVRPAMKTRRLGKTGDGVEVLVAETAMKSDGVLVLNRVKPHTDYNRPTGSGLAKMAAIGLGKWDGAQEIHSHLFTLGLGETILSVAKEIVATGKIIGGVAILENAYHETAKVVGVSIDGFFDQEAVLLKEARDLMGRLPLEEIDVLLCDRIGKNISGTGLDTNIIGRSVYGYVPGTSWIEGMPRIRRIVVRDLADESEGNGVGMGMAEFVTERFMAKVDRRVTNINSLTACSPHGGRMPMVLANDREALQAAIRTSPIRPTGPRIVYVRDTLALENVFLSESCLPLVEGRENIEILSDPQEFDFDEEGYVNSPFD